MTLRAFEIVFLFGVLAFAITEREAKASPNALSENTGEDVQRCLQCICIESNECQPIGCDNIPTAKGYSYGMSVSTRNNSLDRNNRCGYFFLSVDEFNHLDSPRDDFFSCAKKYSCSASAIEAYAKTHRHLCKAASQCEALARLHIGGPSGCIMKNTMPFWNSVKQCLSEENWASTRTFHSFMDIINSIEPFKTNRYEEEEPSKQKCSD